MMNAEAGELFLQFDPSDLGLFVLSVILGVIGWLLVRLYTMWSGRIMEHDEALRKMPDKYATKDELAQLGESIENRLDDIKDAIKEGNTATRLLLSALVKAEINVGHGVRPD